MVCLAAILSYRRSKPSDALRLLLHTTGGGHHYDEQTQADVAQEADGERDQAPLLGVFAGSDGALSSRPSAACR